MKAARILAGTAALAVVLAACGGGGRPGVADWQPVWERVTATVPTATELGDPPDVQICRSVLGAIRTERDMLFPTPDPALDPVVEEWVRVAEDAFFECPPSSASIPDLASAYAELQRLEAEVEVVLRIDTADGCRLEPVARKDQPVPLVPPSAAWPVQAMETATGFYLGT